MPSSSPRHLLWVLVGLLGLCLGPIAAGPAQAAAPAADGGASAPPPPDPPDALPAPAGPPAPTPETAPAKAAPAARVASVQVIGSIDAPGRLEGLVNRMVPRGSYFVETGPADDSGAPVSTFGRLRRALERLGYQVALTAHPTGSTPGADVNLEVKVRAADRVRYIFVQGNWPLRQEDILRSLTLRPGQALPDPGPERNARIAREKQGLLTFFHDRGYMDAQVNLKVRAKRGRPPYLEIVVTIDHKTGYPIGPIEVDGARAISVPDIQSELQHNSWYLLHPRALPFDSIALRQDIAKVTQMYRKLGYAQARITHDYNPATSVDRQKHQVRLHLNVLERKRVEVSFEGNSEFSAGDLKDVLTIFSRGSYSSFETQVSAEAIEQLYRSRGFMFVKVTWRADGTMADVHRIVFTIREGPSLKVRQVAFVGNKAFSASRLGDVVTVREFPWLGFLGVGEGGYASLRQLELDVERLTGFYTANGYPGTTVRCEITQKPAPYVPLGPITADHPTFAHATGLYVRFIIEEAPRIDVGEVSFELADHARLPLDPAVLRDSLDGKTGRPFRPDVVRSDAERLRRMLGDTGYPEATVEPLPVDNGKNGKNIVYQIKLGPAEHVGPMFVRGNFFTSEGTIRRWTPELPEGAPLTISALERSRRNLALIQILNNPNPITLVEEAEVDGVAPVLVEVEERHDHAGVVRVGGGASTEQAEPGSFPLGAYAALGYEHRNLFGQSWLWTSVAELGRTLTRITSDFNNPRFFDSLFRLRLTGSYLRNSTVRLGDLRSGGVTVGLERELTSGVDLSFHYRITSTVQTEYLLRGAGPDVEQEKVAIGTAVGAFGLALEWQRLDSPLVPTRGFKLQAALEWAHPQLSAHYGEETFLKASVRTLNVVPVSRRVSVRYSLRYDQGFPLGGAALLPKVERFFAGGDTTLRGFELDRARTNDIQAEAIAGLPIAQHRPLGGSLRILQNLDLQIAILGAWFGGLFIDSGVVADAFDGLSPRSFRHGAGIAPLVVKLPIGDLSIAWAWPLDPRPGDSASGRLHFNVGLMF